MGPRVGCFRGGCRPDFVQNRSGQAVLEPAAPAASATTSAPAGPPLAAGRLIGANHTGLLVGFVLVGFAFIRGSAGSRGPVRYNSRNLVLVTRRAALTRPAGTAAPPPPPPTLFAP